MARDRANARLNLTCPREFSGYIDGIVVVVLCVDGWMDLGIVNQVGVVVWSHRRSRYPTAAALLE